MVRPYSKRLSIGLITIAIILCFVAPAAYAVPVPDNPLDIKSMTGGGIITGADNEKETFGFNGIIKNDGLHANFEFNDHSKGSSVTRIKYKGVCHYNLCSHNPGEYFVYTFNGGIDLVLTVPCEVWGPSTGKEPVICNVGIAFVDAEPCDYFYLTILDGPYAGYIPLGSPFYIDKGSIQAHY